MPNDRRELVESQADLEEPFTNIPHLTGYDILYWYRHQRPELGGTDKLPKMTAALMAIYEGWKRGILIVEGDNVSLREWRRN